MNSNEQKPKQVETTTDATPAVKVSKIRSIKSNIKSGCVVRDGGGGGGGGYCASYCW